MSGGEMYKKDVYSATLAGLLHDIGKFAQRAGKKLPPGDFDPELYGRYGYHAALADRVFIREFVPPDLQHGMIGVVLHHHPEGEESKLVNLADRWAAGERAKGAKELPSQQPIEARLIPILSEVELLHPAPDPNMRFKLEPMRLDKNLLYPVDELGSDPKGEYLELWNTFTKEMREWKNKCSYLWSESNLSDHDVESYLITLQALLRKYLWCVPSATNWESDADDRTLPDVSLYDHLRLTAAIAACIAATGLPVESIQQDDKINVMQIVRGDLSGIQKFIYRINRPQAETEHIAKRLRGRSYYLQLLVEVVADWIRCNLGLPSVCVLFVGGGRFDLLVPFTTEANEKLRECFSIFEKWLLETFYGELGFHFACEPLNQDDFADMRRVYRQLEAALESAKKKSWFDHLTHKFFQPEEKLWHTCSVCQLTPLADPGVCKACKLHAQLGKHLPHTRYLGYFYGKGMISLPASQVIEFDGAPFDLRVVLIRSDEDLTNFLKSGDHISLFKLNETSDFIYPRAACSFRFLANAVPLAKSRLKASGMEPIEKDDVLHFEAIAKLSTGAERIGILKADVDHLGLIISEGLNRPEKQLRPTISRIATLSGTLDLFFAGLLNTLCAEASKEILNQTANNQESSLSLDKVDGIFYVMYSGGDDLFIIGPWDKTLRFAIHIENEFRKFSGLNPNLSLSAGYVQVKPHYPVQKFSELVDFAEKEAKQTRNALCAFNHRLPWRADKGGEKLSAMSLIEFSEKLLSLIQTKKMPRSIIYDIGRLYREHISIENGIKPMWTPRLYYSLTRRLSKEVVEDIQLPLFEWFQGQRLLMPLSIVSLSMRKE